jgi:hypothetical protein
MRRFLLTLPALFLVAACTEDSRDSVQEPPRPQYLQFEYQVASADSVEWRRLNQRLIDGDITIEEADLGSETWCEYQAQEEPTAAQVDADLVPMEQTRAPYLSAFGHPRSMSFVFLIYAIQARNTAPTCGRLETTLQGLDLAANEGAASGVWQTGNVIEAAARPELGDAWLGPALDYTTTADGESLYFEHAVQSVSPGGYVQGEFRFMLMSQDDRFVVLARKGRFGLNNQQ